MVDIGEDVEFEDEEDQNEALFPEKSQRVFQYEQRFPVRTLSISIPHFHESLTETPLGPHGFSGWSSTWPNLLCLHG
jgi:hypothetical protein